MINTFLALVLALMPIVQQTITVNVETCEPGLCGSYNFVTNSLTVCDGMTESLTEETIAHELIHAVQDARDGIDNNTIVPLLTQQQRDTLANTGRGRYVLSVLEQYPQDQLTQAVEFEAWYFESTLADILFD